MLIVHMLPLSCDRKKFQKSHLVSSKYARFEASW